MANEYLKRTPTSTGNRRVWTWSGWVKINSLSGTIRLFNASPVKDNITDLRIETSGAITLFDRQGSDASTKQVRWIPLLRDFGSWYHILINADTTQIDAANRVKCFLNGVSLSRDAAATLLNNSAAVDTPPRNQEFWRLNGTGYQHYIGANLDNALQTVNANEFVDVFFIDGQALTPDVFGFYKVGKGYVSAGSTQSTDFRPGQWVPKTPRVIKTAINNSGGFGVNGFYLPMNDSNNFGADFHCEPNSIIKLQENLPQPRCRIDGVGDYTGALRDDPFKQHLVLALPFVSGGLQSGFGDYSAAIKGSGTPNTSVLYGNTQITNVGSASSSGGYYGSSAYFDGSGDYVDTGYSINTTFGSGNYTIEFWINSWDDQNERGIFGSLANQYGISLRQYGTYGAGGNQTLSATFGQSAAGYVAGTTVRIQNQWNHIAMVKNVITGTLYLNGVAVGIATNVTAPSFTTSNLHIGTYYNSSYPFIGYIQDFRVYNTAKYKGGFDVPRPYTPVGIATWRAVPDSPANNFATLNPLVPVPSYTYTEGNLNVTSSSGWHSTVSTIGVSTGKWYAEVALTDASGSSWTMVGFEQNTINFLSNHLGGVVGTKGVSMVFDPSDSRSDISYNGTNSAYTTSLSKVTANNDVVGIALDLTTNNIKFYFKGALYYDLSNLLEFGATYHYGISGYSGGAGCYNFGQNPSFGGRVSAGTYTDSNNKGLFKYQPPSGFLALCEDNLPTPAISDPGKHFKTVLYTGNGVPATSKSVVGVGFTPDLVWIKRRDVSTGDHKLVDSVRGAGFVLETNTTDIEGNETNNFTSFANDGFNLGANNATAWNESANYVAWCWKAGAGTTSTNTNGSITSVVSVNQDAGFSIVSYTGNGSAGATVGHGLGITPAMVIIKSRNEVRSWIVFHRGASPTPNPLSSTTFALGSLSSGCFSLNLANGTFAYTMDGQTNVNGNTYIAYCWAEIEGFSKFGSYTGNGSADGPFIYTGGRPAFVMIKRTDSTQNWPIIDSSRDSVNVANRRLFANLSDIEDQGIPNFVDILSNGFKCRDSNVSYNASGGTYIFACWMESPFTTANSK